MSTTDILFNSPALHSLKRAQLVQLCKRHNIKASGKNTELVDRLKEESRQEEKAVDIVQWINFFTFDFMGDMAYVHDLPLFASRNVAVTHPCLDLFR